MIELKTDSRKVKPGDTFIAIKNVNTDGHNFIESAIKNGATKIICERVVIVLKLLLFQTQKNI